MLIQYEAHLKTTGIRSYKDLTLHIKNLEASLDDKKEALHQEIKSIEENVRPITGLVGKIAKTVFPPKGGKVYPVAAGSLLLFLARNFIFRKAGRLSKALLSLLFG
jgi:hypothetical protein